MDDDGSGRGSAPRSATAVLLIGLVLIIGLLAVACNTPDREVSTATSEKADTADVRTGGTAGLLAEPPTSDPAVSPGAPGPAAAPTVGDADATGDPPTEPAAPVVPEAPAPAHGPRPESVATANLALVDPSRATTSGGITISTSRSLPTVVTYPTEPGPRPVLVFAHGFRLGPPGYSRLISMLAASGYVVAAPSFPLADEAVAGSDVDRGDISNQSGDLSFVIDQLLAASADPASPLAGRVDGSRIGAVGHSDGADTVLDLGYVAGRADPRVRAIVALSPDAVVPAGAPVGTATPLLLEHGDADPIVAYRESESVFANVHAHRFFLTLLGAGHLEPVTQATAWTQVLDATIVAFVDRYVAGLPAEDEAITAPSSSSAAARIRIAG